MYFEHDLGYVESLWFLGERVNENSHHRLGRKMIDQFSTVTFTVSVEETAVVKMSSAVVIQ